MNNKILALLVGGIVIVAIAIFWQPISESLGLQTGGKNTVLGINADDVTQITIRTSDEQEITLQRTSSGWQVNEYIGASDIDTFVQNLALIEKDTIVSQNESNYEIYGVAAGNTNIITVGSATGNSLVLYVGNNGSIPNSFYVRYPDAKEVYEVKGNIRAQVTQDIDDWRQKVLFQLSEAVVSRINVVQENDVYSLVKKENGSWVVTQNDKEVDMNESARNKLFTDLLRVEASGFSADVSSESVKAAAHTVVAIIGTEGQEIRMWLQDEDTNWLVVLEGDEIVYIVPKFAMDALLPADIKEFSS